MNGRKGQFVRVCKRGGRDEVLGEAGRVGEVRKGGGERLAKEVRARGKESS